MFSVMSACLPVQEGVPIKAHEPLHHAGTPLTGSIFQNTIEFSFNVFTEFFEFRDSFKTLSQASLRFEVKSSKIG